MQNVRFLYIAVDVPFLYVNDFLRSKTKAPFGFYHQLLMKLSRAKRKENKKTRFQVNYFHFQFFEPFGNLEIDFTIKLTKSS